MRGDEGTRGNDPGRPGAGDGWVDLREVVVEHHREIFRLARSLTRSGADAEDLAQTAVVRVATGRHRLGRGPGQVVRDADRPQPRHRPGALAPG